MQPGLPTVQGELDRALRTLFTGWGKKAGEHWEDAEIDISGSGRTDAGVHALGQVASFPWPDRFPFDEYRILSALNAMTPREMSVLSAELVPDSFDARFAPHVKCYRYRMLLRRVGAGFYLNHAWPIPLSVNIPAMCRAARRFVGQHDFSSFRAGDCSAKSTIRTLCLSEIARESEEMLTFTVHGKGFLKQMIRIMTGTLVEVGCGRLQVSDIDRLLLGRDRAQAGPTAPPGGLTMEWVRYLATDSAQDVSQMSGAQQVEPPDEVL